MINHVLKNGEVLNDITDHIVSVEDAPSLYKLLGKLKEERDGNNIIKE